MMIIFFRRAMKDMADNLFITLVTMMTIALSILIASAAGLLFANAGDVMDGWKKGVKIIAYISPGADQEALDRLRKSLTGLNGVREVRFISKQAALEDLKIQMKRQMSLVDNLTVNPLPDSFEIYMRPEQQSFERIETLSARVDALDFVDDVEYGQAWIGRFTQVFNLFKFIGITMGVLFFMVTVFIISNTIRLALYSRREEIDIMRLVGATDGFIRIPSYIAGMIQGAVGGTAGVIILYLGYLAISANIERNFSSYVIHIRFLSWDVVLGIIVYSIFVGWLGCFLSLRQFLKNG
jgi:cell division transport system permease protein